MNKSKRFRLTWIALAAYLVTGCVAFYFHPDHIEGFGVFIATTSLPLLGYIWGETTRPSDDDKNNNNSNPSK